LNFVKAHPDLWEKDELAELRDLCYEITGDPKKFPVPMKEGGWGVALTELTKDIGNSLFDRGLPLLQECSDIVLQITHSQCDWKPTTIDNCTVKSPNWRFSAIDADGTSIPLRVDSSLHSAANLLQPGKVVKISSFIPIYFSYEDHSDQRCAIVVREFKVVGSHPLSDEAAARPKKRAKPALAAMKLKKEALKNRAQKTGAACACSGEQCSRYGVDFIACITACIPVSSVSPAMVARECVFATKEVKDMSQSEKRFLMYYYYATTVYQFRGKGNRVELPNCLVAAVRARFPNEALIVEEETD